MVAEHGFSSMAMNTFADGINELEQVINAQDPAASNNRDLFRMINTGFQVFHRQVSDINDKIGSDDINTQIANLDQATHQINANLQALAGQVAHQAVQGLPQRSAHTKRILEFRVIQNIKPLTGDKSQFTQWHQTLINALMTINEEHAEIIKTIEKAMDIGDKMDDALDDLDQQSLLDKFNKDTICILMDKCEGEADDKIKGLQNSRGPEVDMIIYQWFTEISGLGLSMRAAKLMSPDPIKKESDLENAVDKWTESNRKLESHGSQFGLAPLYKVIALKKLMVGRAKEHFDLWEAEHKQDADCGFAKILDKIRDYSCNAKLESSAFDKQNNDDAMDTGNVRRQMEKDKDIKDNKEAENNKWWDESINAIAKGKGKGRGFQGNCYNCGEYGHSIINCPKESSQQSNQNKGGKDQGCKGSKGEKGKGKGDLGTCWSCGVVGHSWNNCPINGKGSKGSNKGSWDQGWQNGYTGKGNAWSTEQDSWQESNEEEEDLKFGHQAASEGEPQDEDDLGAVDVEGNLAEFDICQNNVPGKFA